MHTNRFVRLYQWSKSKFISFVRVYKCSSIIYQTFINMTINSTYQTGDRIIEYLKKLKASSCKEKKNNCILPL